MLCIDYIKSTYRILMFLTFEVDTMKVECFPKAGQAEVWYATHVDLESCVFGDVYSSLTVAGYRVSFRDVAIV